MRWLGGVFEVAPALACHAVSSAVLCLQSRDWPEADVSQRVPAAAATSPVTSHVRNPLRYWRHWTGHVIQSAWRHHNSLSTDAHVIWCKSRQRLRTTNKWLEWRWRWRWRCGGSCSGGGGGRASWAVMRDVCDNADPQLEHAQTHTNGEREAQRAVQGVDINHTFSKRRKTKAIVGHKHNQISMMTTSATNTAKFITCSHGRSW